MKDLVTLQDFESHYGPILERLALREFNARVAVLALFIAVFGTNWEAHGAEFWSSVAIGVAVGTGFGLIVGTMSMAFDWGRARGKVSKRLRRIYAGDADIVPAPPEGATHRMPTALYISPQQAFAGILYVTPTGLLFQQHYLRRRWWQGRSKPPAGIAIGPPQTITFEDATLKRPPWWIRPIGFVDVNLLICRWDRTSALAFEVPRASNARESLQECVDALRTAPPVVQPRSTHPMFCEKCGNPLNIGAKFCPRCGHDVSRQVALEPPPVPVPEAPRVELWNPNVAVNWSLLFTAGFGAMIHAMNWRTLGEPGKARASMMWFAGAIAIDIGWLLAKLFEATPGPSRIVAVFSLVWLLSWYLFAGKAQVRWIAEEFGVSYHHRSWDKPLLAAVGAMFAYYLLGLVIATIMINAGLIAGIA